MEHIYKFDTDNGFEKTSMPKFYDAIEDEDFFLMYLGKSDFLDFAKKYKLDKALTDLLLTENSKKSYVAVEDTYTFVIL